MRKSNFELIRIVATLMILTHHLSLFSGCADMHRISINGIWSCILLSGGKIGVNLFVLIGSYFLCDNSKFQFMSIIKIWVQTLIYSITITFICILFSIPNTDIDIKVIIKGLFPCFGYPYWFVSAYIGLLLCTPVLNFLVKKMKRELYKYTVGIMTVAFCIVPSVLIWSKDIYCSNFLWFIYLYLLVGYLKKYSINIFSGKKRMLATFFGCYGLIILLEVIMIFYGTSGLPYANKVANNCYYYINQNVLPVLIASLALFFLFVNMNIRQSKLINGIATTSFGVYLIHNHPAIKRVLWNDIFNCIGWYNTKWYILITIFSVLVVFCVCFIIDILVKQIVFMILKINLINKINCKVNEYVNKSLVFQENLNESID